MNIEGSNLLSLLSGSENGGSLPQGLFAATPGQTGFMSAFMEQLKLLQGSLPDTAANAQMAELAALQNPEASTLPAEAQAAVQNFAALFGNALPTANKIDQKINLDDTLKTLAEVMQHLQSSDVAPVSVESAVSAAPEQTADKALPDLTPEQEQLAQAIAASLIAQVPTSEPTTASNPAQPEQLSLSEEAAAVTTTLLPANKKATTTNNNNNNPSVAKDAESLAQTTIEGSDSRDMEFDRSISALMGQDRAAADKISKDGQTATFKAEAMATEHIESQANTGEKVVTNIASDIVKLNNAVPDDKQIQVPAMSKHFTDPAWNKELGEKLIWMHKQSVPSAELRLNPEHLGPVLIKIDVNQDQASIAFTAQHQVVKEAIEAAMPKLREMFSGQQLQLADVNVSQHQSEQRQARDFFQSASQQGRGAENDELLDDAVSESKSIADEIEAGRAIASNGLLSLFA